MKGNENKRWCRLQNLHDYDEVGDGAPFAPHPPPTLLFLIARSDGGHFISIKKLKNAKQQQQPAKLAARKRTTEGITYLIQATFKRRNWQHCTVCGGRTIDDRPKQTILFSWPTNKKNKKINGIPIGAKNIVIAINDVRHQPRQKNAPRQQHTIGNHGGNALLRLKLAAAKQFCQRL